MSKTSNTLSHEAGSLGAQDHATIQVAKQLRVLSETELSVIFVASHNGQMTMEHIQTES